MPIGDKDPRVSVGHGFLRRKKERKGRWEIMHAALWLMRQGLVSYHFPPLGEKGCWT